MADEPVKKPEWRRPRAAGHHFELSANAIDLDSILGDFDAPPPRRPRPTGRRKTSRSISASCWTTSSPRRRPEPGAAESGDLDGVFGHLRDEASRRQGTDESEKEYKRALALRSAGDIEGCMEALEKASRAPKLRFVTATLLGKLHRERRAIPQAIDWFERAAQAPAPTPDAGYEVLYDLADGLEQVGETARALAILLELQADAGAYRDIDARIDRLTKVQTRG